MPDGPIPARLAFVGEAPGSKEARDGRAFIGPSGQLMWNTIGPQVGIAREDVWVTNTILCELSSVKLESGATLPKEAVADIASACCRRRLVTELQRVNPIVIVPLGNIALQSLSGIAGAKITAYRGSITEVDLGAL